MNPATKLFLAFFWGPESTGATGGATAGFTRTPSTIAVATRHMIAGMNSAQIPMKPASEPPRTGPTR